MHTDLLSVLKVFEHVVTLIVFVELPVALVQLYWCGLLMQLLTTACSHETRSGNHFTHTLHTKAPWINSSIFLAKMIKYLDRSWKNVNLLILKPHNIYILFDR